MNVIQDPSCLVLIFVLNNVRSGYSGYPEGVLETLFRTKIRTRPRRPDFVMNNVLVMAKSERRAFIHDSQEPPHECARNRDYEGYA